MKGTMALALIGAAIASTSAPGGVMITDHAIDNTPRVTNMGSRNDGKRNLAELEAWARKRRRSAQRKRGRR